MTSNELTDIRILFIAPAFYDYENEIVGEMEKQGCNVSSVFYSSGTHRLPWKNKRIDRVINEQKEMIARCIDEENYDILFVIKGEILNREMVERFKDRNPNAKTINYQWDSIDNLPMDVDIISLFEFKYTFDYNDVQVYRELNIKFKPLFYSESFSEIGETKILYDLATVGGMNPFRANEISRMQREFPQYKYKILLRTEITLNLPFNLIRYGVISYFKNALFTDLNKNEVAEILKKTSAIVDISSTAQSGLSMRTLEGLALKRKIITTNNNVNIYDFYHPNNIYILGMEDAFSIVEFMSKPYVNIDSAVIEKYSLENWVHSILNSKQETYLRR